MKPTDVPEFFHSLNAGVFEQQIGRALSEVATGVIDFDKAGTVTIKLQLKRISNTNQVEIKHALDYSQPTKRGRLREDFALSTPMYLTKNGLELFQSDPTAQLFNTDETPVFPRD